MSDVSEPGLVPIDEIRLEREYSSRLPLFTRLEEEARFILSHRLDVERIKAHAVESRTKTLPSVLTKVREKGYRSPFEELEDFVGLRVTLLFLTDVDRVAELIRQDFQVRSESDRISSSSSGADDTFGYMSHHLVATLPRSVSGPRYDDLKSFPIEFQVRTILMDAWANVSHYLDYKNEQSIPSELRRDFFALSGLFFVADKHFQLFFEETVRSRSKASRLLGRSGDPSLLDVELNVDTLTAYLQLRFPERRAARSSLRSELTEELAGLGVRTITDLDTLLAMRYLAEFVAGCPCERRARLRHGFPGYRTRLRSVRDEQVRGKHGGYERS